MDQLTHNLFSMNDFQVTFKKTDTELLIEAENKNTSQVYATKLTFDDIPILTKNLFSDIEDMYHGMTGGLTDDCANTKAFITSDAKFSFQHTTMMGKIQKNFKFDLQLQEVELDKIAKLERQLMKANEKLLQYEKRLAQLEGRASQDFQQITPRFDSDSRNKSYFDFSNQDKTITKNVSNNGGWYGIFAKDTLPKDGKYKFSVKIEKSSQVAPYIMIGVSSANHRNSQNFYGLAGSCFLYVYNNSIYWNGHCVTCGGGEIAYEGDIISICVDSDEKKVFFELNQKLLGWRKIDTAVDLYPSVHLQYATDGVSFL